MSGAVWILVPLIVLLAIAFVTQIRRRDTKLLDNDSMTPMWMWISLPLAVLLLGALVAMIRHRRPPPPHLHQHGGGGSCSTATCGAIDPVSDPAYNMRQVVKQSILLEEHLTQERKRCKDCQLKHLLHIQGLVEEAAMLAGDRASKYAMLDESAKFYDSMLKTYLDSGRDDIDVLLNMASQLREWRKKLAREYFPEGM
jgi:hypothetical protein